MDLLLKDLTERVSRVRDAADRTEAVRRLLLVVSGLLTAASACIAAEALFSFGASVRAALFFAWVLGGAIPGMIYVAFPVGRLLNVLRREDIRAVASKAGRAFPSIRDRLSNVLEFSADTAARRWVSGDLVEESVRSLHADLSSINLLETIDTSAIGVARNRAGVVFGAVIIISALFPSGMGDGVYRLWNFGREFRPPTKYIISVTPGATQAARKSDVSVSATVRRADGNEAREVDEVSLLVRPAGQEEPDAFTVPRASSGAFAYVLSSISATTEYSFRVGGEQSEKYLITVLDWPALQSLRVRLEYPSYAQLPSSLQEEFSGSITALAGTRVHIAGRATKQLATGLLLFDDSTSAPLDIQESGFASSFRVFRPGSYTIRLTDVEGLANQSPVEYDIRIQADAYPTVSILEPGRSMDIAGHEPVGLMIRATDDFGFSEIRVRYRLSHSRYEKPAEAYSTLGLPLPSGSATDVDISHLWDLEEMSLVPEDVVEYFVEALDNDDVNGPKLSKSDLYTLRLPSLEEVFSDLDAGHNIEVEDLGKALEEARDLKKEVEKISQDMKTNKEFDWQKQQQAKELTEKVESIRKKLEQAHQQLGEMTDQMQKQQVLSPETLEKYLELQNLFKQIDAEELQQALKQMQQTMEGLSREQMQEALKRVEFSEERFRQGVERTINLLKRIQIEQKMDEARRRSEDLEKGQRELLEQPLPDERQNAARQEELAKQQENLRKTLGDLEEKMEEFFTEMPADKLKDLNTSLDSKQLSQRMKDIAQRMNRGDAQESQAARKEMHQELSDQAEQISRLQQELLNQQMEQTLNGLRRATTDLLELSRRQEAAKNQSQSSPSNSPALRQNAQDQMRIMQDLQNVAQQLAELAQRSFAVTPEIARALGESFSRMQQAMRDLEVRSGSRAAQDQAASMASLNKAAQEVQKSLLAMMQGSQGSPGGMGLMQQLQLMAGQQMMLNARTEKMGQGEGKGEQEAMRRAAEAARLAHEQDAVRKSLEQLQREAQQSGEQNRVLGDLNRIADEMKEVVKELEQNNADAETVRRQERILSRLLDASRSMRERDFERKREATAGRQIRRESPTDAGDEAQRSRLRTELLKALEKGYSRDYQELIRRYFEELEKQGTGAQKE